MIINHVRNNNKPKRSTFAFLILGKSLFFFFFSKVKKFLYTFFDKGVWIFKKTMLLLDSIVENGCNQLIDVFYVNLAKIKWMVMIYDKIIANFNC
jgi:hypothetical protein